MAVDLENLLADALLELVEQKSLQKITIRELLERTGISRQGFYNHFLDKNALVQWVYTQRIMGDFRQPELNTDYPTALLAYYQRMARYHRFVKEAIRQGGQNNLTEYLYLHPFEWDMVYHRRWCARHHIDIPEEQLAFFTRYHSLATVSISLQWVLEDMPYPPEVLARRIVQMRTTSLEQLLQGPAELSYWADR